MAKLSKESRAMADAMLKEHEDWGIERGSDAWRSIANMLDMEWSSECIETMVEHGRVLLDHAATFKRCMPFFLYDFEYDDIKDMYETFWKHTFEYPVGKGKGADEVTDFMAYDLCGSHKTGYMIGRLPDNRYLVWLGFDIETCETMRTDHKLREMGRQEIKNMVQEATSWKEPGASRNSDDDGDDWMQFVDNHFAVAHVG